MSKIRQILLTITPNFEANLNAMHSSSNLHSIITHLYETYSQTSIARTQRDHQLYVELSGLRAKRCYHCLENLRKMVSAKCKTTFLLFFNALIIVSFVKSWVPDQTPSYSASDLELSCLQTTWAVFRGDRYFTST